jgi:hypothetical protein
MLHVYCFSKSESEEGAADDVVRRLLSVLRLPALAEAEGGAGEGAATSASAAAEAEAAEGAAELSAHARIEHSVASALVLRARRAAGPLPGLLLRSVRNVAPGKLLMCASFRLPRTVAEARDASVSGPLAAETAAASAATAAAEVDAGGAEAGAVAEAEAGAAPAPKRARAGEK